MRKGKIAAQVAHASMKVWFDRMTPMEVRDGDDVEIKYLAHPTPDMVDWKENSFTKVVVSVQSEEEIYALAEQAKEAGLPYAVMIDNGMTEFAGNKTTTCIAIGPAHKDKLDPITGGLKLM